MALIFNVIWFVCGGFLAALLWLLAGVLSAITVVLSPLAPACFRLAGFSAAPFGSEIIEKRILDDADSSALDKTSRASLNLIWVVLVGWWVALLHVIAGVGLCFTLIGIPFGLQHFKLAGAAWWPVGREVVSKRMAKIAAEEHARSALAERRAQPLAASAVTDVAKVTAPVEITLISCEACGNKVSSAAAACPGCGHPLTGPRSNPKPAPEGAVQEDVEEYHSRLAKGWLIVSALIVVVGVGLIAIMGGFEGGSKPQSASAPMEAAIGEPIEFTDYTVTVESASRSFGTPCTILEEDRLKCVAGQYMEQVSGRDFATDINLTEGAIAILVEYQILNSSSSPLTGLDNLLIQLKDQNGAIYNKSERPSLADDSVENPPIDLNPGMSWKNRVLFEVPEAAFDPKSWSLLVHGEAVVPLSGMSMVARKQVAPGGGPINFNAPAVAYDPTSPEPVSEGDQQALPEQSASKCEPKGPTIVKGFNTDRAYPHKAVRTGVEGRVIVRYAIAADGSLASVEVVSANPPDIFEKSVLKEFNRMKWNPATNGDCEPVASEPITETITFRLG